jgi:hypothetical protein
MPFILAKDCYDDPLDDSQLMPVKSGSTNYLLDIDLDDDEIDKILEKANEENMKYREYLLAH